MGHSLMGQQTKFAPAACVHNGRIHMVFVADNDSNELLHAVSDDGLNWFRLANVRQSTSEAPAIASVPGVFVGDPNTLVVTFVANDDSKTLLRCKYFDNDDLWSNNESLGESSRTGPGLAVNGSTLQVYFAANNDSGDILITTA